MDFDLTYSGKEKIENLQSIPSGQQYQLRNCVVNKVQAMDSNGYEVVSSHTFGIGKVEKKGSFDLTVSTQLSTL